jgi:hypothetical protein
MKEFPAFQPPIGQMSTNKAGGSSPGPFCDWIWIGEKAPVRPHFSARIYATFRDPLLGATGFEPVTSTV